MLVLFWRLEPLAEDVLWRRCVAGVRALFLSPENVRLIGKWKRVARLKTIGDVRWRCTLKTLAVLSLSLSLVEDESARSFVFFFAGDDVWKRKFPFCEVAASKLVRRWRPLSPLSLSLENVCEMTNGSPKCDWEMAERGTVRKYNLKIGTQNVSFDDEMFVGDTVTLRYEFVVVSLWRKCHNVARRWELFFHASPPM